MIFLDIVSPGIYAERKAPSANIYDLLAVRTMWKQYMEYLDVDSIYWIEIVTCYFIFELSLWFYDTNNIWQEYLFLWWH